VNVQMILLVIALVAFLIGLLDHPTVSTTRCIALGLALVVLAQLIGGR